MIKSDSGKIEFRGSKLEILADLALIVHELNNNECFEKDEIMHAVEDGFKNAEQINHEIEVLLLKIVMGGR